MAAQRSHEAFPGIQVEIATTVAEGRRYLKIGRPEFALIDLNLPDGSGIVLVAEARNRTPPIPVIVSTIYDDDSHIFPALRAGAGGYILKEEGRDTLVRQIQAMVRGEFPLSPAVAQHVMRYFSALKPQEKLVEQLTEKETQVLGYVASGLNLAETADRIGISRNTVHTHVKHIYEKLGISSRAEATMVAARFGLVR